VFGVRIARRVVSHACRREEYASRVRRRARRIRAIARARARSRASTVIVVGFSRHAPCAYRLALPVLYCVTLCAECFLHPLQNVFLDLGTCSRSRASDASSPSVIASRARSPASPKRAVPRRPIARARVASRVVPPRRTRRTRRHRLDVRSPFSRPHARVKETSRDVARARFRVRALGRTRGSVLPLFLYPRRG